MAIPPILCSRHARADTKFLTAGEVSERYRGEISVGTLRNWRAIRVGPPFVKIASPRFSDRLDAVDDEIRPPSKIPDHDWIASYQIAPDARRGQGSHPHMNGYPAVARFRPTWPTAAALGSRAFPASRE